MIIFKSLYSIVFVLFISVVSMCASASSFALSYISNKYKVTVHDSCSGTFDNKICDEVSVLMLDKKAGIVSMLRAKKIYGVKIKDNSKMPDPVNDFIYKFIDKISNDVIFITHDARFLIFKNKQLQYAEQGAWID